MSGYDDRLEVPRLRSELTKAGCRVVEAQRVDRETKPRWNGALDGCPALIAGCRTADQVASVLRIASETDFPVCVYNGGQDWNGRSWRSGSIVIDISDMATIEIDTDRREAMIGGGVTAAQLNRAAGEKDLYAVIGNDGAVSVAGLTLGGGYGPLMTRFGLACDNLLSVEIVLADGTIVTSDGDRHAELFWSLRGGGGNFGIVTSMRLRLSAPSVVLAGSIAFPWTDARAALEAYNVSMLKAPAELFGAAVLAIGPGGKPVVVISLVWTGEAADGETVFADLAAVGRPIVVKTELMPAGQLLAQTDGKLAQGLGYEVATRWLETLAPKTIEQLLAAFEERTSPLSSIIIHHCHGAATDVEADATAFGMREPHFTVLTYSTWDPKEYDGASHRAWAGSLDAAIDRAAHAYGPNAPRLARAKAGFDPAGRFRAIPIPTGV